MFNCTALQNFDINTSVHTLSLPPPYTHTHSIRSALISVEDAKSSLLQQQQNSSKGRSKELDKLMAATKKGGPLQHVGLRGRLGDLGTIDPEYDVAIR